MNRMNTMAKKPKNAEAETEGAEGAEAAAPNPKKKLVMMGGGALALVALLGGGWFFMMKPAPVMDANAESAKAAAKKAAFLEMKDMMVNISSNSAQDRQNFIKMKVALEISDGKQVVDIQPLLPRIEDTFQVYLRELRPSDLEGSAGMFRLKEELLRRVNVAVYPAKVDAVLFKELLVQ
jgi:flagellar protein FliL